jgi:FkbM family methyltransferase
VVERIVVRELRMPQSCIDELMDLALPRRANAKLRTYEERSNLLAPVEGIVHEQRVIRHEHRQPADALERDAEVALPERERVGRRIAARSRRRCSNFEGIAVYDHDDRIERERRMPERQHQAVARVLPYPWRNRERETGRLRRFPSQPDEARVVFPADAEPTRALHVGADGREYARIERDEGHALPVARRVLGGGRDEIRSLRRVEAEQADESGRGGRAAAMHANDEDARPHQEATVTHCTGEGYVGASMKVFLDVGAHEGSTLQAVRDPKYGFDRIYCFEPARSCWAALAAVRDPRVTVCRFGLWDRTCEHALYDGGSRGASMFEDKFRAPPTEEVAGFVRASDWFREHVGDGDQTHLKLNCEGAECDIVEDLLESGELERVSSVMIDPDIRKIPSLAHRERQLRRRLEASGLANYFLEEEVMVGATHRERIQNWLRVAGAEERSPRTGVRQLAYLISEARRGHREPLRAALHVPPR